MTPETPPPWWSWAPRFPKAAIAATALLYDAVVVGTTLWRLNKQGNLEFWPTPLELLDAVIVPSITANALALAMFLQLNAELLHMILSMKANYEEKKEAVAKAVAKATAEAKAEGKAEGIAEGQSLTEAKFREWYESHRAELQDMPPPPFSDHRNGNSQS